MLRLIMAAMNATFVFTCRSMKCYRCNNRLLQNLEKEENRTVERVGEKVTRIIVDKDNSTSVSAGVCGVGDLAEKSYKK